MELFTFIEDIKIYYKYNDLECYKPLEDSLLLYKWNKKLSKGAVLDMGTGCGIQAIVSAKKNEVLKVVAVDIDQKAIELAKYNAEINDVFDKIDFIISNLFEKIPELKFNTILFNPPYLPEDPREPENIRRWTSGGKKGNEIILKFLKEVRKYLREDGFILLVFSSLSNKEEIDDKIESYSYEFKVLDQLKLSFEELYVYKIWKI